MKKILLTIVAMFAVACVWASTNTNDVLPNEPTSPTEVGSNVNATVYKVYVTVYKRASNGQTWPYEYVTVAGKNSYGFSADFKTDSKGRATIEYYGSSRLSAIFVKGKKFEGNYEDGGSYTFYYED